MAFYNKIWVTEFRDGKMLVIKEAFEIDPTIGFTYEVVWWKREKIGKRKRETHRECIQRESIEEVACTLNLEETPEMLWEYVARSRKHPRRKVRMHLYKGTFSWEICPQQSEGILGHAWVWKEALETPYIQKSPLMEAILIDLIERGMVS